jgi:hypothetical protein
MAYPVAVSKNGRMIVFGEASGARFGPSVTQKLWAVPADASSPARQITPDLQPGQVLLRASPVSPDGRWVVYGINHGGGLGGWTYHLADLRPDGTSTPIPLPQGAWSISGSEGFMFFGASSQFLYFTATFLGSAGGYTAYRVPVDNLAAPVRISPPPSLARTSFIRMVSEDESRIGLQVTEPVLNPSTGLSANISSIEIVNVASPDTGVKVSHAFVPNEVPFYFTPNAAFSQLIYFSFNAGNSGQAVDIYAADTSTAGSGRLATRFESYGYNEVIFSRNGDGILLGTVQNAGNDTYVQDMLELNVDAGTMRTVKSITSTSIAYFLQYKYVDNDRAIAYTTETGLKVMPRSGSAPEETVFEKPLFSFDVSPDSRTFAILASTTPDGPLQLWVTDRTARPARQITGHANPEGEAVWMQVIPAD